MDAISVNISTRLPELSAEIESVRPVIAANLEQLRCLVFQGMKGDAGESAYELAAALGFEGTEQEWLNSLHGADGADGKNYGIVVDDSTEDVLRLKSVEVPESAAEVDAVPTSGSENAVSSGGVYTALAGKASAADALHGVDTYLNAARWASIYGNDFNALPNNVVLPCGVDNSGGAIVHGPDYAQLTGLVITLGRRASRANGDSQFFVPWKGQTMCYRQYQSDGWTSWVTGTEGLSDLPDVIAALPQYRPGVNAAHGTYHNLLSNYTADGTFMALAGNWSDLPGTDGYVITNAKYSGYVLQTAVGVNDGKAYNRIVHAANHTVFRGWKELGALTVDAAPTADSPNPVSSGGVYAALQNVQRSGWTDISAQVTVTGANTSDSVSEKKFLQNPSAGMVWFSLKCQATLSEYGYAEFVISGAPQISADLMPQEKAVSCAYRDGGSARRMVTVSATLLNTGAVRIYNNCPSGTTASHWDVDGWFFISGFYFTGDDSAGGGEG